MALDILPYPAAVSVRLAPVELRYVPLFCFALLTAACALASFAFACASRSRPSPWSLRRCCRCGQRFLW